MRDFHLKFYRARSFNRISDIIECDVSDITTASGAYVLGTSDGTMLIYPWGSSPIFYIVKAKNLRARLSDHKTYIKGAIQDHEQIYWWPRYQYGAAFGMTVAWYSCSGRQDPNNLEAGLIQKFYDLFGSIPIANGVWPGGIGVPAKGKRDD